jgi:hypothetical protein
MDGMGLLTAIGMVFLAFLLALVPAFGIAVLIATVKGDDESSLSIGVYTLVLAAVPSVYVAVMLLLHS